MAGTDLSEFGRRRKTACDALTRNAMRLADEKGTLRVATMESLGSLMLIEELVQSESTRVFSSSLVPADVFAASMGNRRLAPTAVEGFIRRACTADARK